MLFQEDTDNVKNFPNMKAFHAFKRQRQVPLPFSPTPTPLASFFFPTLLLPTPYFLYTFPTPSFSFPLSSSPYLPLPLLSVSPFLSSSPYLPLLRFFPLPFCFLLLPSPPFYFLLLLPTPSPSLSSLLPPLFSYSLSSPPYSRSSPSYSLLSSLLPPFPPYSISSPPYSLSSPSPLLSFSSLLSSPLSPLPLLGTFFFSDGFYAVMREWEKNHLNLDWNIQESLGDTIRYTYMYLLAGC